MIIKDLAKQYCASTSTQACRSLTYYFELENTLLTANNFLHFSNASKLFQDVLQILLPPQSYKPLSECSWCKLEGAGNKVFRMCCNDSQLFWR